MCTTEGFQELGRGGPRPRRGDRGASWDARWGGGSRAPVASVPVAISGDTGRVVLVLVQVSGQMRCRAVGAGEECVGLPVTPAGGRP